VGGARLVADLPSGCFASIELQGDGVYYALIGCDGERPFVLSDRFDDRAVAQAWVEDKTRLQMRGIDIARKQGG
jgi:hypothetical protein